LENGKKETDCSVAVFDSKPYDRLHLPASTGSALHHNFLSFRLSTKTAIAAQGARAVCVFVNDVIDRTCLEVLANHETERIALRCTGFDNVDLSTAQDFGIAVTRVPVHSPHAVAEHAVALLLTLNRKIHRAFNRVRELDFSLHGLVGFDLNGKTVGIVGTGKIGRILARILRGFGMVLVAYDP
jgi:D-lactate dehydrogenase